MSRSLIIFCVLVYWAISLPTVPLCNAHNITENLSINGYLSVGYIDSRHNNFLGESLDGSFQLNEFALTTNYVFNDKLRFGLQLLSRDVGMEGNNDIIIDWAVIDYQWRDWLGLRLGKVKLPIGLYNQSRDIDFLRPLVFLPQSIYDENKRMLVAAANGGSVYGNFSFGDKGDLEYQAYAGRVDYHNDSGQARGIELLVQRTANQKGLGPVTDFNAENDYVYGGSLMYYPPLDNLRFGVSYFTGETDFDFMVGGKKGYASGHNKDFIVLSMEYAPPDWRLSVEYTEYTGDRKVLGKDIPDGRSQGGYVQLCYHILDQLIVSGFYDVFYTDKRDQDGDKYVAQGMPRYLAWRKDFGLGLRWDITSQWLVKAEHHWLSGAALGLPIYNPQGVEEDWSYFVLKTSFNF